MLWALNKTSILPFQAQGVSPYPSPSTVFASHFSLASLCVVYEVGLDHLHTSHDHVISLQKTVEKNTEPFNTDNRVNELK